MKTRTALIFFILLSYFATASDFYASSVNNSITLDFYCENKIIVGNFVWIKGTNCVPSWKYHTGPGFSKDDEKILFNPLNNAWYYYVSFDSFFASTCCSITAYAFYDNKAPSPRVSVAGKNVDGGDLILAGDTVFNVSIPADICDSDGAAGCGISSVSYTLDGKTFYTGPDFYVAVEGEGHHDLNVSVTDLLGNSASKSFSILLDYTAPVLEVTPDADSEAWQTEIIDFSVAGSDVPSGINESSWMYSLDGGSSFTKFDNSQRSFRLDKEGVHGLVFKVKDRAGNETVSAVQHIKLDTEKPCIFSEGFSENKWVSSSDFTAAATDTVSGINPASWRASVGGETFSSPSIGPLPDGIHDIEFSVSDFAGNRASAVFRNLCIDTVEPRIEDFSCVTKSSSLTGIFSDERSGIQTREWRNGSEWKSGGTALVAEGRNSVSFRVVDWAGNVAEKSGTVIVDTEPAEIVFSHDEYFSSKTLTLKNFSVTDALSEKTKVEYSFDGGFRYETRENNCDLDIYIGALSEGRHSITVFADDTHDNFSQVTADFTFDRTDPEIREVKYMSKGHELGYRDYILPEHDGAQDEYRLVLKIDAQDMAGDEEGELDSYFVSMNGSAFVKHPVGDIVLVDFVEGKNVVRVKACDRAGNFSSVHENVFLKNSVEPLPPVMYSSSHRKFSSIEHTEREADFAFEVNNILGDDTGIRELQWVLRKIPFSAIGDPSFDGFPAVEEGTITCGGMASVKGTLFSLQDNSSQECYLFEISALSFNGLFSKKAFHVFRIDTNPPENFFFRVRPQLNGDEWYSERNVLLTWSASDSSGIEKVSYAVCERGGDHESLDWKMMPSAERLQFTLSLSGEKDIYLRCHDFAGNFSEKKCSMKIDCTAPRFIDGGEFRASWSREEFEEDYVDFILPQAVDEESGIAFQKVTLKAIGRDMPENKFYVGKGRRTFAARGIGPESDYEVSVQAFDEAGNFCERKSVLLSAGSEELPSIEYDYSDVFDGISFSARVVFDFASNDFSSFSDASFVLPGNFSVKMNGTEIRRIECDSPVIRSKAGAMEFFGSKSGNYEVDFNGRKFRCGRICFSSEEGLSFLDVSVPQRMASGETSAVDFERLTLGFSSFYSMNSTRSFFDALDVECGGMNFFDATSLVFLDDRKNFSDETYFEFSDKFFLRYRNNRIIPLDSLGSGFHDRENFGILRPGTELILENGTVIKLQDSFLSNSVIFVNSAEMELDVAGFGCTVLLSDFSIDLGSKRINSGTMKTVCRNHEGEETDSFDYSGIVLDLGNFSFSSDNLVSCSASVCGTVCGDFHIERIFFSNNAVDLSESFLPAFQTRLFGFTVQVDESSFVLADEGLCLDVRSSTAFIWGAAAGFSDYRISLSEPDTVFGGSVTSTGFRVASEYGSDLFLTGASLSEKGFFADLKVKYPTSEEFLGFGKIPLEPRGDIHAEGNAGYGFSFGTYTMFFEKVLFDGRELSFSDGTMDVSGCGFFASDGGRLEKIQVPEAGFSFFDTTRISLGNLDGMTFRNGQWNFSLKNLSLSKDGLNFFSHISMSDGAKTVEADFEDFRVVSCGDFFCEKSVPGSSFLRFKDSYEFVLEKSFFEKDGAGNFIFVCDKPLYRLYDRMPEKFLEVFLGRLCVDGSLSVVNESLLQDFDFFSFNSMKCHVDEIVLQDSVLRFSGTVRSEILSGIFDGDRFNFGLTDFSSVTTLLPAEASFGFNGWKVSGRESEISMDSFRFRNCAVGFRDVLLDIGDLVFDSRGMLLESAKKIQSAKVSPGFDMILKETDFSSKGFFLTFGTRMSELLGNTMSWFSDVQVFPDGTFLDQTAGREKRFSFGKATLVLEDYRISGEGFSVGKFFAEIPLGGEKFSFTAANARVGMNGVFSFEDGDCPASRLFGMFVSLEKISLDGNGFCFSADVVLPECMPEPLGNRSVRVKDFRISKDGLVSGFDFSLNEPITAVFLDSWTLCVERLSFRMEGEAAKIVFSDAQLRFPQNYIASKITVSEISFNLGIMAFDFGKISADINGTLCLGGIDFQLENFSVSDNFSFSFRASFTFDDRFPEFLAKSGRHSAAIGISSEGGLDFLEAKVRNLSGHILPGIESVEISDGFLGFRVSDGDLITDVGGKLLFSEKLPGCFRNLVFDIRSFVFDLHEFRILELDASAGVERISFDCVEFRNVQSGIFWNQDSDFSISVSLDAVFPESLPSGLAGTVISVEDFRIDSSGKITSGTARFNSAGDFCLADGLLLQQPFVELSFIDNKPLFRISSGLCFSEDFFPSGIASVSVRADIVFSGNGLENINASGEISGVDFFDYFKAQNISFWLSLDSSKNIIVELGGTFIITDTSSIPGDFGSVVFVIDNCVISSAGEIKSFLCAAAIDRFTLFKSLEFTNNVLVMGTTEDDFVVAVKGEVTVVSEKIPEIFSGMKFKLDVLTFSFREGIQKFSVTVDKEITFPVLHVLDLTVSTLSFSDEGFSCTGNAALKNVGYIEIASIDITKFKMGWDGQLKDIGCNPKDFSMNLLDFEGSFKGLNFMRDLKFADGFRFCFDSCSIKLPDNFGSLAGRTVSILDSFFGDGKFFGKISIDRIKTELTADFWLEFVDPALDFTNYGISCKEVKMHCPQLLKNAEVDLKGVSVTGKKGLEMTGAAIRLPNFEVGNNASFSDVFVEANFDGGKYRILGNANFAVTNVGAFASKISFINVSKTYPVGLEKAYFSFEVSDPQKGIPLGNSGLYITGARGGLCYGYPYEVAPRFRNWYRDDGIRIQLGINIKDKTGSMVEARPDSWIDVKNFTWLSVGPVLVGKGLLDLECADASMFLSSAGMYTDTWFNIIFTNGNVKFYCFDKHGRVTLSGLSEINFYVPKGALFDKWIGIGWLGCRIAIPPFSMPLWNMGAYFGDFTNGMTGFCLKTEIFGFSLGAYISNYGVYFGNVGYFSLESPDPYFACRGGEIASRSLVNDIALEDSVLSERKNCEFFISPDTERFGIVEIHEGPEPEIMLISPGGDFIPLKKEFFEVYDFDGYRMYCLQNPESGKWRYFSDTAGINCDLSLICARKLPDVVFEEARFENGKMFLKGRNSAGAGRIIFSAEDQGLGFKRDFYEGVTDADGNFAFEIDCGCLPDGNFTVSAGVFEKEWFYPESGRASNQVQVHRRKAVSAPESVRVLERDGCLVFRWSGDENFETDYVLRVKSSLSPEKEIFAGKVSELALGGFSEGEAVEVSVAAVDAKIGCEVASPSVTHTVGSKRRVNVPESIPSGTTVEAVAGREFSAEVPFAVKDFLKTGTSSDWFSLELVKVSDAEGRDSGGMFSLVPVSDVEADSGLVSLEYYGTVKEDCDAGRYSAVIRVFNEGNPELSFEETVAVEVLPGECGIIICVPDVVPCGNSGEITVCGYGFTKGSVFCLDGVEVPSLDADGNPLHARKILVPENLAEGAHTVSVVNGAGLGGEYTIEAKKCAFSVRPLMNGFSLVQGDSLRVPLLVEPQQDVAEKDFVLKAVSCPGGISFKGLRDGDFFLELSSASDCPAGKKTLVLSGPSNVFQMEFSVVEKEDAAAAPDETASGTVFPEKTYAKEFLAFADRTELRLRPGTDDSVFLRLSGFGEDVQVRVVKEAGSPFNVDVEKVLHSASLLVCARSTVARNGSWSFRLELTEGGHRFSAAFRVVSCGFVDLETNEFFAHSGQAFDFSLVPVNCPSRCTFLADRETLPSGVKVSESGRISGRVKKSGRCTVKVHLCGEGFDAEKDVFINVRDLAFEKEGFSGGTNFIGTRPRNGAPCFFAEENLSGKRILGNGKQAVVWDREKAVVYRDGSVFHEASFASGIRKLELHGELVLVLLENSDFHVLRGRRTVVTKHEVEDFAAGAESVFVAGRERVLRFDLSSLRCTEVLEVPGCGKRMLVSGDELYRIEGSSYENSSYEDSSLISCRDGERKAVFGGGILRVMNDGLGYVVVTARKLYVLGTDFSVVAERKLAPGTLQGAGLSEDRIVLVLDGFIHVFDRFAPENFTMLEKKSGDVRKLLLDGESLFVLCGDSLHRYSFAEKNMPVLQKNVQDLVILDDLFLYIDMKGKAKKIVVPEEKR